MADTSDQVSRDSVVGFVASYTVEHFKNTGRRTDGAVLADAIREKFPEFSYEQVGLGRLSDAVRVAEQRGLVIRHRDVKHLEISPGPNSGLPPGTEVAVQASTLLRHVRPEIWRAFVFVSRGNVCFLGRSNGHAHPMHDWENERIASFEADGRYIRLSPIPVDTQQSWMEDFTRSHEALNIDEAPIRDGQWWLNFSAWLREMDAGLEREWNRFRTGKVLQYLREWASSNNVPLGNLLSPEQAVRPTRYSEKSTEIATSDSETLRDAILAAVREMPLEQLEEIAIPVRYILRHFKPR